MGCNSSKTFYLDASSGADTNDGLSPKTAWRSLARANEQIFEPGNKILFKSGERFEGQFEPKGSGDELHPVIVDSYGEGEKPLLEGNGAKQHTVLLEGLQYWEVNNLEITNLGENIDPRRYGLIVYSWDVGETHHIYLRNLTIHDVNGTCVKSDGAGGGINMVCGGDEVPTRYIDLLVEDCHVYRCQRDGIKVSGNTNRTKWYPNLGVVIRRNLIEQVPGDGIVPKACDGALVEWNVVRDSPDLLRIEDAAAGIWPWSCDNTTIRYNEVSGQQAKWDAQGFDSDYNCRGTLIEYNYSHDNNGGFVMVCNEGNTLGEPYNIGTEGSVIRNNVSINDGQRPYATRPGWFSPIIHISGPAKNTLIENNTMVVFTRPDKDADRRMLVMDNWGGPWPEKTRFINNSFYIVGSEAANAYGFDLGDGIETTFDGNHFYGTFPNSPEPAGLTKTAPAMDASFVFPEGYPDELKQRVLKRLNELTSVK